MGSKGGALTVWIKEFTALVFTQTIQAFIYAVIISIILYGMGNNSGISATDNNSALGLMATFALLSVFKVEELAKKIFGIHDTKATPGNAMKSIAKTAIAAKLGKRALDNIGKVTGGIGALTKYRQDNKKLKKRLEEDMQDNGFIMGDDGKPQYVGKRKSSTSSTGSVAQAMASSVSGSSSDGSGTTTAGAGNYTISDADKRRMRNAFRTYEDKMSEIKKARDAGIKDIFKGTVEGMGSVVGATAGGLLGGADGNLDEMLQGIMAGAGVGDALGESAVNTVDRALQFASRNIKREAGLSGKRLKQSLNAYKNAVESANIDYNIKDVSDI